MTKLTKIRKIRERSPLPMIEAFRSNPDRCLVPMIETKFGPVSESIVDFVEQCSTQRIKRSHAEIEALYLYLSDLLKFEPKKVVVQQERDVEVITKAKLNPAYKLYPEYVAKFLQTGKKSDLMDGWDAADMQFLKTIVFGEIVKVTKGGVTTCDFTMLARKDLGYKNQLANGHVTEGFGVFIHDGKTKTVSGFIALENAEQFRKDFTNVFKTQEDIIAGKV